MVYLRENAEPLRGQLRLREEADIDKITPLYCRMVPLKKLEVRRNFSIFGIWELNIERDQILFFERQHNLVRMSEFVFQEKVLRSHSKTRASSD